MYRLPLASDAEIDFLAGRERPRALLELGDRVDWLAGERFEHVAGSNAGPLAQRARANAADFDPVRGIAHDQTQLDPLGRARRLSVARDNLLESPPIEPDDDVIAGDDHRDALLAAPPNHLKRGGAIDRHVLLDVGNSPLAKELLRSNAPGSSRRGKDGDRLELSSHGAPPGSGDRPAIGTISLHKVYHGHVRRA